MHFVRTAFLVTAIGTLVAAESRGQGAPTLVRVVPERDSATARQVLHRTRVWHDAIMRADTAALRHILLPEYSLTVPPDLERGHIPLEAYLRNTVDYQLHADRWEASDVRVLGDIVVVASRYWQRATPRGRDRSGYFLLTDIWRKEAGEWRVASRWSTRLDVPADISPAVRK